MSFHRFYRRSKTGYYLSTADFGSMFPPGMTAAQFNPNPGPFQGSLGQNLSNTSGPANAFIVNASGLGESWQDSWVQISIADVKFYQCISTIVGQPGVASIGLALRCSGTYPNIFGFYCSLHASGGGFGVTNCGVPTAGSSWEMGIYTGNNAGAIGKAVQASGDLGGQFVGEWRFEAIGYRPVTLNLFSVLPDGSTVLIATSTHDWNVPLSDEARFGAPGFDGGNAADGNGGSIPHSLVDWSPAGAGQLVQPGNFVTMPRTGSGYWWTDQFDPLRQDSLSGGMFTRRTTPTFFLPYGSVAASFTPPATGWPASDVYVSLHSADPGGSGANEIGGYTRQKLTGGSWEQGPASTANGLPSNVNHPAVYLYTGGDVSFHALPAATPKITFAGLWTASVGGTFLGGCLLPGTGVTGYAGAYKFNVAVHKNTAAASGVVVAIAPLGCPSTVESFPGQSGALGLPASPTTCCMTIHNGDPGAAGTANQIDGGDDTPPFAGNPGARTQNLAYSSGTWSSSQNGPGTSSAWHGASWSGGGSTTTLSWIALWKSDGTTFVAKRLLATPLTVVLGETVYLPDGAVTIT